MGGAGDRLNIRGQVSVALICAFCKKTAILGHRCKQLIEYEEEQRRKSIYEDFKFPEVKPFDS